MRKSALLAGIFAAAVGCGIVSESLGQYCDFPPKALTYGERREYRGIYRNKAYGYSVVIPRGLVAYDVMEPSYQRGFGIILGTEQQSYISVNGEPNSLEFARPADAASEFLSYLRGRQLTVLSSKIAESRLGGLEAATLVAEYTCPASLGRYMRATVAAIGPNKGMLYQLTLYAHAERFDHDRRVFDALVKSWRYIGTDR